MPVVAGLLSLESSRSTLCSNLPVWCHVPKCWKTALSGPGGNRRVRLEYFGVYHVGTRCFAGFHDNMAFLASFSAGWSVSMSGSSGDSAGSAGSSGTGRLSTLWKWSNHLAAWSLSVATIVSFISFTGGGWTLVPHSSLVSLYTVRSSRRTASYACLALPTRTSRLSFLLYSPSSCASILPDLVFRSLSLIDLHCSPYWCCLTRSWHWCLGYLRSCCL